MGANVARTLSLVEMCSKWSKTGRSESKLAQKVPKRSKRFKTGENGSKGVKMGQKVPRRANEGVRKGQNGGRRRARKGKKS